MLVGIDNNDAAGPKGIRIAAFMSPSQSKARCGNCALHPQPSSICAIWIGKFCGLGRSQMKVRIGLGAETIAMTRTLKGHSKSK